MQYPFEFDPGFIRYQFGQCIGFHQWQIHYTCYVFDTHLGGHGTIGNDLRYLVLAIFFHHIIDHFLTAFIIEVRIDIGHRLTIGIQKTLK